MYILRNYNNLEQLVLDDAHNSSQNHIIWEIESSCNLKCKYCYPTRTPNGELTQEKIKKLVDEINSSKISNVHITGGEPTQSSYLEFIIKSLCNKRVYVTTNLVNNVEMVEQLVEKYKIYSVAVSLDSIQLNVNDRLRGKTKVVLSNIERLVNFKRSHNLKTKIRIHCVISKLNLTYIPELLRWAKSMNVDEVSCQPISIGKDHKYYNLLHLEYTDIEDIKRILHLENSLFNSKYAVSHSKLLDYYLRNQECVVSDCRELCSLFIDANGDIWNCPRKLSKQPDVFSKPKAEDCSIIPQCMTCLKHLEVLE